jgi:hypothetical protein
MLEWGPFAVRARHGITKPSMSRFFHALVVFGAGVSLSGCGGKTHTEGLPDSGSGGSSATGGTDSSGSGGNSLASGGSDSGSILDPATFAQWSCTGIDANCVYDSAPPSVDMKLHAACPIDPKRPRYPADCRPGEWFECDAALFQGKEIAVDCRCTQGDAGVGCTVCAEDTPFRRVVSCGNREKICSCFTSISLQ